MRRVLILLVLIVVGQLSAQEQSTITIKGSEINNGVIIVTAAQQGRSSFALHCNKGMPGCKMPDPGTYLMVRLPKNWGMYDCANVDLYPASAEPNAADKIGQYCLIAK